MESLKETVYHSLMESIIRGEYRPNEIITERTLTEKYGFSKAPVREALSALCSDGVLRNLPRCGYEVIRITREDIDNMLEYRVLLEGGLLQKAFSTITAQKLAMLRKLDEKCRADQDSMWEHWESNTAFHLKLLSYAGNDYAYKQLERTMTSLKYAFGQYYWDKWDDHAPREEKLHHSRILDGIERNDLNDALSHLMADLKDFDY